MMRGALWGVLAQTALLAGFNWDDYLSDTTVDFSEITSLRAGMASTLDTADLCPVTPTPESVACRYAYRASAYLDTIFNLSPQGNVSLANSLSTTSCAMTKLGSVDMCLTLYCYYMGLINRLAASYAQAVAQDPTSAQKYYDLISDQAASLAGTALSPFFDQLLQDIKP